jgi:hypothetical protein
MCCGSRRRGSVAVAGAGLKFTLAFASLDGAEISTEYTEPTGNRKQISVFPRQCLLVCLSRAASRKGMASLYGAGWLRTQAVLPP